LEGFARKAFFFEKKNQKTFGHQASAPPQRFGPGFERFLVLFLKKDFSFLKMIRHINSNGPGLISSHPIKSRKIGPQTIGVRKRRPNIAQIFDEDIPREPSGHQAKAQARQIVAGQLVERVGDVH
jgi:hypothetical protein